MRTYVIEKMIVCFAAVFMAAVITTSFVAGEIEDTTKVDQSEVVEKKIRTIYGGDGRPVNQGQDRKGWHQVTGSIILLRGNAVYTMNTSTALGRQDVSFLSESTYWGVAWSLDTTNTNRYWVVPLTGTTFMVKSSDGADTATVQWKVEGE